MEAVKLSPEERALLDAQAARGLVHILVAQFAVLMVVVLLTGLVSGVMPMVSALAGGMTYFIPTFVVVLRMLIRLSSGKPGSAGTLFIAEGIKIVGTIALLILLVKFMGSMIVWPALLLGLIAVMKSYFFLLIFKKV
ncbi:ATP synthase subunit I [Pelistega europaea]|uniref:ATP synthase protein I n=1 Tax=Pelistega europaea TaxID=106147 RepID=A0A7Y4P5I9_9BURK|nr:ATP synthase subunit I [Pelistega europaea]NOL48780.1 hypothetical protein [Pelistega europaea]